MNKPEEEFEIKLTEESKKHLSDSTKWIKYFSSIIIIAISLSLVVSLYFFYSIYDSKNTFAHLVNVILQIGIASIFVFPSFYLLKFSTQCSESIKKNDSDSVNKSFKNISLSVKSLGICLFSIVGFCFILIIFFN